MWKASIVTSLEELQQILALQQKNLKQAISDVEKREQGFVTLEHTLPILEEMHGLGPSVIIKDEDKVVAYALTELPQCRHLMPDLEPMFALLDSLQWNNRTLSSYRFYVMGQVCVASGYRGMGLFEELYQHHKKIYQSRFDLFITQISTLNTRSIRAHERVGFKTIHTHRDEKDEWLVVGWDWN